METIRVSVAYILCKVRVTDLAIPLCFSDHHHQHPSPKYVYKKVVHHSQSKNLFSKKTKKYIFSSPKQYAHINKFCFPSRTGSESLLARIMSKKKTISLYNIPLCISFLPV